MNTPYDAPDERDNEDFKAQFSDYESLASIARSHYKYSECGLGLGFTLWYTQDDKTETVYDDDLRELGDFKALDDKGILITEIHVNSIVEGVDECAETIIVKWTPESVEPEALRKQFDVACEDVEGDAKRIWDETHGCEDCSGPMEPLGEWEKQYEESDLRPINPECKSCGGNGRII